MINSDKKSFFNKHFNYQSILCSKSGILVNCQNRFSCETSQFYISSDTKKILYCWLIIEINDWKNQVCDSIFTSSLVQ